MNRLPVILVALALFFTSCGENNQEESISQEQTEEAPAPESSTPSEEVDAVSEEEAVQVIPNDNSRHQAQLLSELSDQLRSTSFEQCLATDHFAYLQLEILLGETRVHDNGAFFEYDCVTTYWGWYHESENGRQTHEWRQESPTLNSTDFDSEGHTLAPLNKSVPTGYVHPAYPEAPTLGSLNTNDVVCYNGNREYTVVSKQFYGYRTVDGGATFYPVLVVQTDTGVVTELSMEDFGLIPLENGLWTDGHFIRGYC